jgi:lipopolysaccharide transport system ATP-binding protein
LTGRENIYLNGAILGMRREEIDRRFDEIVAFSEVEEFMDTPVKRYSSGMYLRLAFAVAAYLDPEILLVDEVLAVGDQRFQQKCLGKMEKAGGGGRTVMFVSHNMPAVARLCERTVLLDKGEVIADGPTGTVVARYLNLDEDLRQPGASVSWPDPSGAPGTEEVRLKRIQLLGPQGTPQSEFEARDPVEIEVQFWVLRETANVVPMIRVYNEDRLCVFGSAPTRDPILAARSRQVGTYTARCRIPSLFMAEGFYSIELPLRPLYPRRFFLPGVKLLSLRIVDSGGENSVRGEYRGLWPGVVAPALDWRSDYLSRIEVGT